MRRLAPALVALLAATSALAAEKPKTSEGQYLDISPVGLPIVWQGKLINYVFVAMRVNLTQGANAEKLRGREPYFRDSLVRAAHDHPFVRPWDFTHVDRPALIALMTREAGRIAGPGQVRGVEIMSETPQRFSGLPRPPQAPTTRAPTP